MNRTVTIGGTGFHGDYSEKFTVDESRIWDKARIEATYKEPMWFPEMMVAVGDDTIKRLTKNACGMSDCCCSSGPQILDIDGDLYLIGCEEA